MVKSGICQAYLDFEWENMPLTSGGWVDSTPSNLLEAS
jgi:hypothetical protein